MSADVKVDLSHLEKLVAELKAAEHIEGKVGILEGATYSDGTPVSQVAGFLEMGWVQSVTPKQAGFLRANGLNVHTGSTLTSPPRPVFHVTTQSNKDKWINVGKLALKGIGGSPLNKITQALRLMGSTAQQDLQDAYIDGGDFARRSPATLAIYAFQALAGKHKVSGANQTTTDKPLYRTGLLAGSIAYEIVTK